MLNRYFVVKIWKCGKAVSLLPHEAKALLELFCLQPIVIGESQNSSSSSFSSWGKIKMHDFTLADQDWIGLMIFKNFADQDWIGFNFIGSGLDSDWKISQSAHRCSENAQEMRCNTNHRHCATHCKPEKRKREIAATFVFVCTVWQFPSIEEEQHTFRTTPREHWQILVGVFKARPS